MSVDQYQRAVNDLDSEIANLEKRRLLRTRIVQIYRVKLIIYKKALQSTLLHQC